MNAASRGKRILIFSLTYYPRWVGGAEVAVKEITDRLSQDGFSFDLITLGFDSALPASERIGSVQVHRVGFTKPQPTHEDLVRFPLVLNKYLFPFLGLWKAILLYRKNNYEIIWSIMANYAGFAALFLKFMYPKIPFLLTLQEGDPIEHIRRRVWFVYPLFVSIFRQADFVQVISRHLGTFARDMGYTGPLEIIPNGVDLENFQRVVSGSQKEALRRKLSLHEKDRVVVSTSRLVKKNGIEDLIHSLSYLPEHVKLLVVGDGPDKEKLEDLATKDGVSSRVTFCGFVDQKNIPDYLAISEVFVRPSLSEGLGNSFIEAMAAGLPIVGTSVGGITDFLKDGETGLLCKVQDPKDIAGKISRFLEDRALRTRIIENARIAAGSYGWEHIARAILNKVFLIISHE